MADRDELKAAIVRETSYADGRITLQQANTPSEQVAGYGEAVAQMSGDDVEAGHLLAEANKYWKIANAKHPGAVQWIENEETGDLLIFTRGEYRDTLMRNIESVASQPSNAVPDLPTDVERFRVAEFWSSANPGKKVLWLSVGDEIEQHERRKDFIRWVSPAATVPPVLQVPSDLLDSMIAKMLQAMSAEDGDGDAYYNRGIDKCMQIVRAALTTASNAGNASPAAIDVRDADMIEALKLSKAALDTFLFESCGWGNAPLVVIDQGKVWAAQKAVDAALQSPPQTGKEQA